MKLKASFHIHTAEDPKDGGTIKYNVFELIDRADELNFNVLALTCHNKLIYNKDFVDYAESKGILLIRGVELGLERSFFYRRKDIIVLNCDKSAEEIKTISDLRKYKEQHPDIFILAPDPGFGHKESLGIKRLIDNIDLFDAIELSWFYSKRFDNNKKAVKVAKKYNKPLLSTSDAHSLKYFNQDYAIIETEEATVSSVLSAIKKNKIENFSQSKNFLELAVYLLKIKIKYYFYIFLKYVS